AWVTDPWTVVEQDGRLYGRGTCDMKGFLAMALHALVDARDKPLKRPLQIAFSRDEEIGLLGAPDVAQALLDNYAKAEAVIVGEPTQMDVVTGHKSCEFIKVHVRGFEVHSSRLHEGVSAVMFAARFISWIHDQNVAAQSKPATTMAAMYDPPFTTLHTGVIQGGTASNITAKDCLFTVDLRCVGDENGEDWLDVLRAKATELQGEMQLIHPDTGIDFDILEGPSVAPEQGGRAEELARQFTGDNGTHTVSYGTDGGHFQKAGFSVVVCGPGSIEQAHQPNEFLEIAEFEKGQAFLAKVVHHLCQG
ncbi:MAG: M20/M25/M40 family metallo-hydrolase, partial [Planktomarina sp.]